jgi:hypothetical protein
MAVEADFGNRFCFLSERRVLVLRSVLPHVDTLVRGIGYTMFLSIWLKSPWHKVSCHTRRIVYLQIFNESEYQLRRVSQLIVLISVAERWDRPLNHPLS